jgi:endonuclease YncB( thermonuclease family)
LPAVNPGLDRYGRTLATVFVDGIDANLEQVRSGMAWVYQKYIDQSNADIRASYLQAENEGRKERLGLWSDPHPIPPWEWRHAK